MYWKDGQSYCLIAREVGLSKNTVAEIVKHSRVEFDARGLALKGFENQMKRLITGTLIYNIINIIVAFSIMFLLIFVMRAFGVNIPKGAVALSQNRYAFFVTQEISLLSILISSLICGYLSAYRNKNNFILAGFLSALVFLYVPIFGKIQGAGDGIPALLKYGCYYGSPLVGALGGYLKQIIRPGALRGWISSILSAALAWGIGMVIGLGFAVMLTKFGVASTGVAIVGATYMIAAYASIVAGTGFAKPEQRQITFRVLIGAMIAIPLVIDISQGIAWTLKSANWIPLFAGLLAGPASIRTIQKFGWIGSSHLRSMNG